MCTMLPSTAARLKSSCSKAIFTDQFKLKFGLYTDFWAGLAKEALNQGRILWKIRPKFHQQHGSFWQASFMSSKVPYYLILVVESIEKMRLDHLVIDCTKICNPMLVANYCEEDLVGRVKRKLGRMDCCS